MQAFKERIISKRGVPSVSEASWLPRITQNCSGEFFNLLQQIVGGGGFRKKSKSTSPSSGCQLQEQDAGQRWAFDLIQQGSSDVSFTEASTGSKSPLLIQRGNWIQLSFNNTRRRDQLVATGKQSCDSETEAYQDSRKTGNNWQMNLYTRCTRLLRGITFHKGLRCEEDIEISSVVKGERDRSTKLLYGWLKGGK